MTDVEGDKFYMMRYVEQSKILCWRESLSTPRFPYGQCIDFLGSNKGDNVLVYGGDVWDQGGWDLFAIRQLLHLKQRYPDNVHFVLGNRDLNKIRVVQELGSDDVSMPLHKGVYWLKGRGCVGDPSLGPMAFVTSVERLQWMLSWTMGSPRAFQYRKEELQEERLALGQCDLVSDEDVVVSYRTSCHPTEGEMGEFLKAGCLTLRLGEVVFLHGALPLTDKNLLIGHDKILWDDLSFAMPFLERGVSARDVGVDTIDKWFDALNSFANGNVAAWRSCNGESDGLWSLVGGYNIQTKQQQPYGQLLQYGMGSTPDRIPNPTVVYNSWGKSGKPRKFWRHDVDNELDQSFVRHTREFFDRTGIRLICSGHQPSGEMPNYIRIDSSDRTCWILACDTSYSGDTQRVNVNTDSSERFNLGRGSAKSGRGEVAVSEVLIEQDRETGAIRNCYCHGRLSDGSSYTSQNLDDLETNRGEPKVGTVAEGPLVPTMSSGSPHNDPWWTQSALTDGSVVLASGHNFNFWTCVAKP
jgi:Calcineurin-like phosphoesterase